MANSNNATMANMFIQWNCRGLRANFDEIELLIDRYNPLAVCLQELKISDTYSFNNNLYALFSKLPQMSNNSIPHGGAGILVRKDLPHSVILLNTPLQVVACRISTPQPLTICSIYLPPSSSWKHTDLLSIVSQLPTPILLLGDFNAHSSLWGCNDTNSKGQEVLSFLLQSNLCLLNKKITTYIHPATGARSSIDLAICDPTLFLELSWNVYDDLCGSDHLPVILSTSQSEPQSGTPRWNLLKADWDTFRLLCQDRLHYEKFDKSVNPLENFSRILLEIASETIPKKSKQPHKKATPWFNVSCRMAVGDRKNALRHSSTIPLARTFLTYVSYERKLGAL
jgi:exonuclease III